MLFRVLVLVFLCVCMCVLLCDGGNVKNDRICSLYCTGIEYECSDGSCYCAHGFILNYYQFLCVKCPEIGDICWGRCCSDMFGDSLQCWQGTCQLCYDSAGNWICRDNSEQFLMISSKQILVAASLIIAIFATYILIYKLCAVPGVRPQEVNLRNRLSIGSLQIYVDERLRDAPPRYSRTSTPAPTSQLVPSFINAGFVPDGSIPPPPYTPKPEESTSTPNTALHI